MLRGEQAVRTTPRVSRKVKARRRQTGRISSQKAYNGQMSYFCYSCPSSPRRPVLADALEDLFGPSAHELAANASRRPCCGEQGPSHILLVEDTAAQTLRTVLVLESAGFRVQGGWDGRRRCRHPLHPDHVHLLG